MTPLSPDREAVILREMRVAFSAYEDCPDAAMLVGFCNSVTLADRIWSHVESLNAAALVEAKREGAHEALTEYGESTEHRLDCAKLPCPVFTFRDREYPPPRPAIAPVSLSGGRTLAWDAERKCYIVTYADTPIVQGRHTDTDTLCCHHARSTADARAILAFVAQVEGVATC